MRKKKKKKRCVALAIMAGMICAHFLFIKWKNVVGLYYSDNGALSRNGERTPDQTRDYVLDNHTNHDETQTMQHNEQSDNYQSIIRENIPPARSQSIINKTENAAEVKMLESEQKASNSLNVKDKVHESVRFSDISDVPDVHVTGANCHQLFQNRSLANNALKNYNPYPFSALDLSNFTCDKFIKQRRYPKYPISPTEADFPIAYSILLHRNSSMAERLLRAIYQPQNVYCLHLDLKASITDHRAIAAVASCLPNVLLASETVSVTWGKMSLVEAEMACLRTLWNYGKTWKYYINLAGEEFPLKTNGEIVKMLQGFNGTNAVHGSVEWYVIMSFHSL